MTLALSGASLAVCVFITKLPSAVRRGVIASARRMNSTKPRPLNSSPADPRSADALVSFGDFDEPSSPEGKRFQPSPTEATN